MPRSPSMKVIALRHDAVLRYAGSYDMRPPSPSSTLIWRRSVAWIVPSVIGSVYSRPVRLSVTLSVSSATVSPFLSRLGIVSDRLGRGHQWRPVGLRDAAPARRDDPSCSGARSQGGAERRLDVRSTDRALAATPRLPGDRCAEGRDDGAVRVSPLASGDHRPVLEGGELLRPALVAGRGVVPRPVPAPRRRPARGRGEPELPVPSARPR